MYWPVGIPNRYSISKELQGSNGRGGSGKTGPNGDAQHRVSEQESGSDQDNNDSRRSIDLKTCRATHIFATITSTTASIWQTKPSVLLSTATRSSKSLQSYGANVALYMRPDALAIVVQTELGYLIIYSLDALDGSPHVYQLHLRNASAHRRQSDQVIRRSATVDIDYGPGDGSGIVGLRLHFRAALRIDGGISAVAALDEEIMVATGGELCGSSAASIQSIRWSGREAITEPLEHIPWFKRDALVVQMVHDRPMGLYVWVSSDGSAYAVQRESQQRRGGGQRRRSSARSTTSSLTSDGDGAGGFKGYRFHLPADDNDKAVSVAVNARFSLIAVACRDASVRIYAARDYLGNIPLSHILAAPEVSSRRVSGNITALAHSPDGYCTFVGYERGWAMWSVYGKQGASSFGVLDDTSGAGGGDYGWLRDGVRSAVWVGGGAELIMLSRPGHEICTLNMARGAATGCFAMPNIFRSLLQTSTSLLRYRGHGLGVGGGGVVGGPASGGDEQQLLQWQTLRIPAAYLGRQWPMRSSVISTCDKYVAVAGRRGLAHYSTTSGRWKWFDDVYAEDEFAVRGGMCWYQHILVAAVDADGQYQIRLYSREKNLAANSAVFIQEVKQPVIHISIADSSSLLVYTHENVLLHYIFEATATIKLVQVGQIGFGGIIRAPARVRSISWIVPDEQRERGEASQDVATAAVLFLIDGKLVLLQPSPEADRELKYDMRVIAHDVEFYLLAREGAAQTVDVPLQDTEESSTVEHRLSDSLWYYNGRAMHVWPDVHDLVSSTSSELGSQHTAAAVALASGSDFYPLAPLVDKGILAGLEPEIVLRRDVSFAYARTQPRAHLFIPGLLQHYLARFDSPAALHLCDRYKELPYFAHALEVLLHDVLDREVDAASSASSNGEAQQLELACLLPFLSSFPSYLEIVVSCARKTELRSWQTLFKHLPPVTTLFEAALEQGALKTAAGFLLVLHTFDEDSFNADMMSRLLQRAVQTEDWELGKELARFLVGIDGSGALLRRALHGAGLDLVGGVRDDVGDGDGPKALSEAVNA